MQNTYGGGVVIASARTIEELMVDLESLSPDSNTKVFASCRRCGEEFLRERCHVGLPHACPAPHRTPVGRREEPPFRFEIMLTHPDAKMPFRKRVTDAGYDIASIVSTSVPPHGTVNVPTGLRLACPPGTYFTIEGRSSMWINGVTPYRGIIDAGYNGDLMVALMNISDKPYAIEKGDRIAQIIAHQQSHIDFSLVQKFSPEYDTRGQEGFGSSGK